MIDTIFAINSTSRSSTISRPHLHFPESTQSKSQFLLFLTSYIVPCNLSVIFSIPPFPSFSLFTVPMYLSVSAMMAASLALSRILHYETQYLKSFPLFLFIFPIGHIPHFKSFFPIFHLCSSKSHHLFISCSRIPHHQAQCLSLLQLLHLLPSSMFQLSSQYSISVCQNPITFPTPIFSYHIWLP